MNSPLLRSAYRLPSGQARRYFSNTPLVRLPLAYNLHQPSPLQDAPLNHPIIFMHGLFGSKQNNRSISKALARDLNRPIYAIDLRNHGDSPHAPRHDYTAMAEDVEKFIHEHKIERPTLIGHSMGAKTAMTVALRHPDLIANLIPVDNAPIDAALKSDFGKYVRGMKKVEEANVSKQKEADAILEEYEESLPIRQFLMMNLIRDSNTGKYHFRIPIKTLANALDDMADFPFKNPDEVRYEGPTLFIRGTNSHYLADDALPVIGKFFPRFELRDVESGHWVISENPEAFREENMVLKPGRSSDNFTVTIHA
ncbi:MAG: hypothetical protein M1834_000249 [Cirrosporium novae-zelandiae]|nr:MAG: hypothetical protein M1834_000249 [Cirrosporium novae-zelandiae]